MEDLRELGISQAIDVILDDVDRNKDTLKVARSLVKAVRESDRDDQGRSLFGSDAVIGVILLRQGYGAQVIGLVSDCNASLYERVYRPLGFQLAQIEGRGYIPFYEALGKALQRRF